MGLWLAFKKAVLLLLAGGQRVVAQSEEQRHKLEIYGTRGVSVTLLCLQLLIPLFGLPLPIGSLLSLPVSS